jgi:maleate cis-trans isomerase
MSVDRPYGYRARIGSVSPGAANEIKPFEFYQAAPPGTSLVLTELTVRELTEGAVDEALQNVVGGAIELSRLQADFIIIGGTPLVVMKPVGFEEILISEVQEAVGQVPVATAMSIEVAALRHLGLRRIVVATPWGPKINNPLSAYLERHGFDVLAIAGAGVPMAVRGSMSATPALELGASLLEQHPEADGLYFTCPNWPTLPAVQLLEDRYGKPVLNAIAAFVWYPLDRLGRFEPVAGRGRLLGGGIDRLARLGD